MKVMKDSGIEWIGEIPEDWEVKKVKYCCENVVDKVNYSDEKQNENLMYIGLVHVEQNSGQLEKSYKPIYYFSGETVRFEKNDVLFGKQRPYLAKCILAQSNGKCSSEFFVLRSYENFYFKFLRYTILSKGFIDYDNSSTFGVKMPRADWHFVSKIHIPCPPLQLQQRIADYLDKKCEDIDKVIFAKQRQNELLKEQRQSIIYEAVTKGMDKNVKYRDSGVGWIGEIPEDWGIKKLKYCCYYKVVKMSQSNEENLDLMYIGLEHVEQQTGRLEKSYQPIFDFYGDTVRFEKKDILFGKLRPYLAKCFLAETPGKCSSEFFVLQANEDIHPKYLQPTMLSKGFVDYVDSSTFGDKMPRADWHFVGNIQIPYPCYEVQKQIADYLEQKCAVIDSLINSNNSIIDKLKEYRQSIIYEAVTGKIMV